MILATQVANHEPFQSYKNIEEPKTPTPTLNRNGSASRLSSKQSSKQYSERKMSRQFQNESERANAIEPISHQEIPEEPEEEMLEGQREVGQGQDRVQQGPEASVECKLDDCVIY